VVELFEEIELPSVLDSLIAVIGLSSGELIAD